MATWSKNFHYFALGGLVDYLRSSCLSLKTDHQRFVLLLASSEIALYAQNGSFRPMLEALKLENVHLQAI